MFSIFVPLSLKDRKYSWEEQIVGKFLDLSPVTLSRFQRRLSTTNLGRISSGESGIFCPRFALPTNTYGLFTAKLRILKTSIRL